MIVNTDNIISEIISKDVNQSIMNKTDFHLYESNNGLTKNYLGNSIYNSKKNDKIQSVSNLQKDPNNNLKQSTFSRVKSATMATKLSYQKTFDKNSRHSFLKNYNKYHLERLQLREERIILIISILSSLLNFLVITILYFEHFSFVRNKYVITEEGNIIRWVCVFLSIIVCILISIRILRVNYSEHIKFLLNLKKKINDKTLMIKSLVIEFVINLIQPYPYLDNHWEIKVLGNKITFSLNQILLIFCILRSYIWIKVLKRWNLFYDNKSRRIFRFFKNKQPNIFFLKANIEARGFITLIMIFIIFIYIFSLIFKIAEDFDTYDEVGFSIIWNCLWYILVTVTTIGYGDYTPKSIHGRIIGVFCSIIGIFLLSLLIVTLVVYSFLDSNEEKAFKQIDLLNIKYKGKFYIDNYFHTYLKYKMCQLKKNIHAQDYLIKRNRYKIDRETFLLKIKASLISHFGIKEFCNNIREIWFGDVFDYKYELFNNYVKLCKSNESLVQKAEDFMTSCRQSKKFSFRMFNLSRIMTHIGSNFEIQTINQFNGRSIFSDQKFDQSIREFHLKFRYRKFVNDNSKRLQIHNDIKHIYISSTKYTNYNVSDSSKL